MVPWTSSAGAMPPSPGLAKEALHSAGNRTGLGCGAAAHGACFMQGSTSRSCQGWRRLPVHPLRCLRLAQGSTGRSHSRSFTYCWARSRLLLTQKPQRWGDGSLSPTALSGDQEPDSGSAWPDSTMPLLPTQPVVWGGPIPVLPCLQSWWALLDALTGQATQPAPDQGLSPRHNPAQAAWEGSWQPELPACASQQPGSQGRR